MNNNVKENSINNHISRYGIVKNQSNYEELRKVIEKKDYFVYKKICELVNSSRIVEATNDWLIVEIDSKENNHLVEDLGRKFFIKRINQRRVEKKVRHGYILENLFVTFKVLYF